MDADFLLHLLFYVWLLAMFCYKILQSFWVSLRPNRSAAKAGITLRLEGSSVFQGHCQKTNPIWPEYYVREKFIARPGNPALGDLSSTAFEARCPTHIPLDEGCVKMLPCCRQQTACNFNLDSATLYPG